MKKTLYGIGIALIALSSCSVKEDVVESHNCIACYRCLDKGVCPKEGALLLDVHGVKRFWGVRKNGDE